MSPNAQNRATRRPGVLAAIRLALLAAPVAAFCALATGAAAQMMATGERVTLRGLDKLAGETVDIEIATGAQAEFGRLQITLVSCRFPVDDPAAEAYAFLEIHDRIRGEQLFRGWMIATSPALNALDDPRYDVWVLGCQ
ncbi:MAG: DUF2155 domain-containing protein [Pararhodobacter sp.]|nr:DUF2155 domain-containing protein [Pararhodobacter sp.]